MKLITKTLIVSLVLAAGVAVAEEEAKDPTVIARQDLMKTIGKNTKVLGDMAGEKTPFDAAAAEAAKAELIAAAADITAKFETEATDPASEALPKIWTSWDDFGTKAEGLKTAVAAIDVASIDTVKAGMGGIGDACKACHTDFRVKK